MVYQKSRAKSAVVELDTQPNANSSEPPYEAIMQQIVYLMFAITNQNANNNGPNGMRHNNGNGKFLIQKPKGQREIKKICFVGDVEVLGMGEGNA